MNEKLKQKILNEEFQKFQNEVFEEAQTLYLLGCSALSKSSEIIFICTIPVILTTIKSWLALEEYKNAEIDILNDTYVKRLTLGKIIE